MSRNCSNMLRPEPPYSVGQVSASQPRSAILARNARSTGPLASLPRRRASPSASRSKWSRRNPRTSSTQASWAGVSVKSTSAAQLALERLAGTGHRQRLGPQLPRPRHLVAGDALLRVRRELSLGRRREGLLTEYDDAVDAAAP